MRGSSAEGREAVAPEGRAAASTVSASFDESLMQTRGVLWS